MSTSPIVNPATTTSSSGTNQRPPLHRDVMPLAEHALESLRLTVEKAVAHVGAPNEYPLSAGSLEATLAQQLNRQPADVRQRTTERLTARVRGAAPRTLPKVDLRSATSILQQASKLLPPLNITDRGLLALDEPEQPPTPEPSGSTSDLQTAPGTHFSSFKEIQVRLRKVRCVDETNSIFGEAGDDEIAMGVIRLDPNGEVANLGTFRIHTDLMDGDEPGDFDDGEVRTYNPPKILASWKYARQKPVMIGGQPMLVNGKPVPVGWPRTYGVRLVLAETDNGGFPQDLADATNQLRMFIDMQLLPAISSAVGKVSAGAIGSVVGSAVGKLINDTYSWIMDAALDWFMAIWEDDLFPMVETKKTQPGPLHGIDGQHGVVTKTGMRWVKAHDGHYEMYYEWHLV